MLFAIVRKRTIASVHGSQSLLSCPQWPELHNSHFITTFPVSLMVKFRPTALEIKQAGGQTRNRGKWLENKPLQDRQLVSQLRWSRC